MCPDFKEWLFVLGTILSSEQKVDSNAEPTKSLYNIGDNLLDVYYRLHPKPPMQTGKNTSLHPPIGMLLKMLDRMGDNVSSSSINKFFAENGKDGNINGFVQSNSDNPFISVLASTLNYCEIKAGINVQNRCYIVGGGEMRTVQVLKKYKSKEDFILNSIAKNYTQSITRYPDICDNSEVKRRDDDDYCIFSYGGLVFGIDICLDHSRGRLLEHLKKNTHDYVDVQIITSCGMTVKDSSVIAKTNGLVFNCDGEYVIENEAENGEHSHTILKMVKKCWDLRSPAVTSDYIRAKAKYEIKGDDKLYPYEKCHIHIYTEQQKPER